MHLYLAVRGILSQIDRWEQDLSAGYYPHLCLDPVTKKPMIGQLQLSIRPVRLYEVVFPEPMLNTVLRKLQPTDCWNANYQKYLWVLKKALGLDDVPLNQIPARISSDAFCFEGVDVTAIGLKKDAYVNGYEQI